MSFLFEKLLSTFKEVNKLYIYFVILAQHSHYLFFIISLIRNYVVHKLTFLVIYETDGECTYVMKLIIVVRNEDNFKVGILDRSLVKFLRYYKTGYFMIL
jgi:hypothetical protein